MKRLETEYIIKELSFSAPDYDTICRACDSAVNVNCDIAVNDFFGEFYGWNCPVCNTLYNWRNEIIEIGNFGEVEQAEA